MDLVRQVIVFDAADLEAESAFWAGILGGHVFKAFRAGALETRPGGVSTGGARRPW